MILGIVETSGEHPALARREVEGAVAALDGSVADVSPVQGPGIVPVEVPDRERLVQIAARLALARRVAVPVDGGAAPAMAARREGATGRRAVFRRWGAPSGTADRDVVELGRAYVQGGGTIDLETPEVRYWLVAPEPSRVLLLREVAEVDRGAYARRAMPRLPFRRPVSLPPRLGRAAMNLAAVRPGDRVLDPFLGTGALLAEAGLLGARLYGIDADPTMVRGSLRNLAHLGVRAELVAEGDARTVEPEGFPATFDAIVTDPPYGRASASVGAGPSTLVPEVLSRWVACLRPDAAVVVLAPGGPPSLGRTWTEELRIPARVHRSLTREFRRYRRIGGLVGSEHSHRDHSSGSPVRPSRDRGPGPE